MSDAIVFLWLPFLVAVCLVGIHAYFGIQVLARKVIFVDLALAQIAALGATAAFMLGHPAQSAATYGYSLAFTLLAAVLLAFTRAWGTRVPQEALIGVIYGLDRILDMCRTTLNVAGDLTAATYVARAEGAQLLPPEPLNEPGTAVLSGPRS